MSAFLLANDGWKYSLKKEKDFTMGKDKATAQSLTGLVNDLTAEELLKLTCSENRPKLKKFLTGLNYFVTNGLLVTYDQSLGLRQLIESAVGEKNIGNINGNITQERFPLKGVGARIVKCKVVPFLNGETGEEAAKRLTVAGYKFGNTGDLAGFLHDHPEEVEKWSWVVAISEDSRWTNPNGYVNVPCVSVLGTYRDFCLDRFRRQFFSGGGVLVLCE